LHAATGEIREDIYIVILLLYGGIGLHAATSEIRVDYYGEIRVNYDIDIIWWDRVARRNILCLLL